MCALLRLDGYSVGTRPLARLCGAAGLGLLGLSLYAQGRGRVEQRATRSRRRGARAAGDGGEEGQRTPLTPRAGPERRSRGRQSLLEAEIGAREPEEEEEEEGWAAAEEVEANTNPNPNPNPNP